MALRTISVTRLPTVTLPENSKTAASATACLSVNDLDDTEDANALETSLAPGIPKSDHPTRHACARGGGGGERQASPSPSPARDYAPPGTEACLPMFHASSAASRAVMTKM